MLANRVSSLVGHLQNQTFSALYRHPNYRLYWIGALTSNIGTWTQFVAQGWLVYDLTGSATYLGVVSSATGISSLILPLFGGVLADRFQRRRLMVGTQTASMLLAFMLAYLTISGAIAVWHIITIAFLNGVVNALNTPVRQTIISDLVPKEDLMNAIAINSAQFQTSRTLGPALAGVIVAVVGPGWCFFINGLSFLAVIAALLAMRVPPLPLSRRRASLWSNLTEGLVYIRSDSTILLLLGLAAVPSLFGMFYQALMPAFAESVLDVGAQGLGLLMSAVGLGAVMGALGVASLRSSFPRGRLMVGAVLSFGACLMVFGASRFFPLSLLALVGVGASSMVYNALNQTFLQTHAHDHMRGRVMSLLTLTTFGLQPLGTLQAGALGDIVGPPVVVLGGGLICAAFALGLLARRDRLRGLG